MLRQTRCNARVHGVHYALLDRIDCALDARVGHIGRQRGNVVGVRAHLSSHVLLEAVLVLGRLVGVLRKHVADGRLHRWPHNVTHLGARGIADRRVHVCVECVQVRRNVGVDNVETLENALFNGGGELGRR